MISKQTVFHASMGQAKTLTHNDAILRKSDRCQTKSLGSIWALSSWYRHTPRSDLEVQYAFSILLILGILPFTEIIAFCCVLHRYSSRGIHRWKLWFDIKSKFQNNKQEELCYGFAMTISITNAYSTVTLTVHELASSFESAKLTVRFRFWKWIHFV